jgi:leucyl-tRNA synthetase
MLNNLRKIENSMQSEWETSKTFEVERSSQPKYFVTFPYPYMNGRLHLGHAFTITKAEFSARFQKLLGKNVLFPFAFHCTGMPIQSAANKLKLELSNATKIAVPDIISSVDISENVVGKFSGKKTKLVAKTDGITQKEIMIKNGIPEEELHNFTDSEYWLKYFPPLGKSDLQKFGLCTDWRRSFITTSTNPFYNSFIRWQFNTLKKLDKIGFGKRPTIYSMTDGQACADHERASGEGVQTQEYTLIKLRLQSIPDKINSVIDNAPVFFVAATLRPETMYGQTNCFLLPEGDYGVFKMFNNEYFICSERSIKNMMMQGYTDNSNSIITLKGHELFGIPLSAPLCSYPTIYTLPMLTISMNKGTGVVIGVPSDSPDDYITLHDLQNKAEMRTKYGITEQHVNFPLVEIIDMPDYGSRAGEFICNQLKIKSQNDSTLLKQAKNLVYQTGFYKGVMKVGSYVGKKVFEAKPLVRAGLINSNDAIPYWEPESTVVSRSGDECVVALIDQWYIKYGEEDWKNTVKAWIESPAFNTFNQTCQDSFEQTLAWLREWACSRSFGLGTKLPWDEQFVIESLSDSTIYMAYYTFAHLLHKSMDGSVLGSLELTANLLTDDEWDYVLLNKSYNGSIDIKKLDAMKNEFEYWYPMDLRVSGKDLIQNHLTMSLYSHSAIWANQPNRMPQAFFCNGHILVDDEKMSKSKGNFIMLEEAINRWSADAVRFGLAQSGDTTDDANFKCRYADEALVNLEYEEVFIKDNTMFPKHRDDAFNYADKVFNEKISKYIIETKNAYTNMRFCDVVKFGFFEMRNARDSYKDMCKKQGFLMHKTVVLRFIETMFTLIAPICPHFCEYVWTTHLNKKLQMQWPVVEAIDKLVLEQDSYMSSKLHDFRRGMIQTKEKRKNAKIVVSSEWPEWQSVPLKHLASFWNQGSFPDDIKKTMTGFINSNPLLKSNIKKIMSVINFAMQNQIENGSELIPMLQLKVNFDEYSLWKDNITYVTKALELDNVEITFSNKTDDIAPMQAEITFI